MKFEKYFPLPWKSDHIAYIGWGAHADDFLAFKPYRDGIVCLWNYDPNDGVDVSEVPTSLLWSSNEEIRDYFIEQEYKWKEHEIELANRNIKLYTEKIEDCNKIIDGINSGLLSSKQAKEVFFKAIEEKKEPKNFISKENAQISDVGELEKIIDEIIENLDVLY